MYLQESLSFVSTQMASITASCNIVSRSSKARPRSDFEGRKDQFLGASDAQIERFVDSKWTHRSYRDGASLENEADLLMRSERRWIANNFRVIDATIRTAASQTGRCLSSIDMPHRRAARSRKYTQLQPQTHRLCIWASPLPMGKLTNPLSPAASFHKIGILPVAYTLLVKCEADGH